MNKLKVLAGPRITEMENIITENNHSIESSKEEIDHEERKNKDQIPSSENLEHQNSIKKFSLQINLEDKKPITKAMSELKLITCKTSEMNKKLPDKDLNKANLDSCSSPNKANEDKSVNLFNILKRAKILSSKIKKVLYYKNYRNMTKYQKEILDDNSYFFVSRENRGKKIYKNFEKFFLKVMMKLRKIQIISKIIAKFNAINPDRKIKKCWDIYFVILTFLNFFFITFEITFFFNDNVHNEFKGSPIYNFIKFFNIICYLFDILLTFYTGVYVNGTVSMDLKTIRQEYYRGTFIPDIISYIPLLYDFFEDKFPNLSKSAILIHLLFFFILNKYSKKLSDFKEFLIHQKEEYECYFSISVLYLRTIFISHVMACFWYLIGLNCPSPTWLTTYEFLNESWGSQYLNSLYWSLVTMLTVGYGDISPQNNYEKIYCIITMLIGFTLFGFTLGSFGDIIHKINAKQQNLYDTYKVITKAMKKNSVDFDFQFRVRKYLEYCFEEENEKEKEEIIYNKLSTAIKNEYHFQMYGKKILSIPFFSKNFSKNSILSLCKCIKKVDLAPDEIIFKKGDVNHSNFYFIFKGEVLISIPSQSSKILFQRKLKENQYFNEFSFVTDYAQTFDAKALTYCTFYMISREDFINTLKNCFFEDYEKFCLIKNKIEFDKNYVDLNLSCFSCQNNDHIFEECPFLHYIANRQYIINKENLSKPNERKPFLRNNKILTHINSVLYKNKLHNLLRKYEYENKDSIDWIIKNMNSKKNQEKSYNEESLDDDDLSEELMIESSKAQDNSEKPNIESEHTLKSILLSGNESNEILSPSLSSQRPKKKINLVESETEIKEKTAKESLKEIAEIKEEKPPKIRKTVRKETKFIKEENMTISTVNKIIVPDFFDFSFESPLECKYFYPESNFKTSIRKFQRYLRIREKKLKRLKINIKT